MSTAQIATKVFEVLETEGPTEFLRLAEKVAPECDVGFREVERVLRILLARQELCYGPEHSIALKKRIDGNGSQEGGSTTRSQAQFRGRRSAA
jgi:hypothetical protein